MESTMTERQRQLSNLLTQATEPITGTELSARLGVTRQVVVHEIAILRAQGLQVISTPRGYLLHTNDAPVVPTYVLSVNHPPELTATELFTMVDFGLRVVDVQVDHPIYGELKGSLHLASRRDVELFLSRVQSSDAQLLSSLTDGHHLHTVQCADEHRLMECIEALRKSGVHVFQ